MKDVAIYDSRGGKLTGFNLDKDFVTSFDEGIYWYAGFSENSILIGSRINNVKNSEVGRYDRYAIFLKLERKTGKLNLIKAFKYLYSSVKEYFEKNGFIWDGDFNPLNECPIDEKNIKRIISTLNKKGKAEIAVKIDENDEDAIRKKIEILHYWQCLIDEFEEDYIYENNIVMCFGHKNINADIWFNLNNRDNLDSIEFNKPNYNIAFKNNKKDINKNINIENLSKNTSKVYKRDGITRGKRKSTHNLFKNILQFAVIGIIIAIIIILLWYVKFK